MREIALLDRSNVVIGVVTWDGNTDTWQPPTEAVKWVEVTDPDLFVETGGTLDPDTMEFQRAEPKEIPAEVKAQYLPPASKEMLSLVDVLVKKGVITIDDAKARLTTEANNWDSVKAQL